MFVFREAQPHDMKAIYRLRYEIYCQERNYLAADEYQSELESDELDQYSAHLVCEDSKQPGQIIGYLRLITNNPYGFPCENHFHMNKRGTDARYTVEFSRYIIAPEVRTYWRYICLGLLKEVYLYGLNHQTKFCYAILEKPLLHQMQRLSMLMEIVGEGEWYQGGMTYPIMMDFAEWNRSIQQASSGVWYYDYLRTPPGEMATQILQDRMERLVRAS